MTLLYVVCCLLIFAATFKRLVLVDRHGTRAIVRVVFVALGSASIAGLYWSLFHGYSPAPPDLLFAVATAAVQWVSGSRLWRGQVPSEYRVDGGAPCGPAAHPFSAQSPRQDPRGECRLTR